MNLIDLTIYPGRNIYSHRPAMKLTLDLGDLYDTPTSAIPGFNTRLLMAFPGLAQNTCSLGYPGGFLERLTEGTYLTHVLEHAILDLQNTLGYDVKYGKSRLLRAPSVYYLVCEVGNPAVAVACAEAALLAFRRFLAGQDAPVEALLAHLRRVKGETDLGPGTAAIAGEARALGIPVTPVGEGGLLRLGYGKGSLLLCATLPETTSCIAADMASDKALTKEILTRHRIPVPPGEVVGSAHEAWAAARRLDTPVAIKPLLGNQGRGITLNVTAEAEVRTAFHAAARYSPRVLVEGHVTGGDYRVLVVGGKVCAVARRTPAAVTGDGLHSIKELVEIANADPRRGERHEKSLTKLPLDDTARALLARGGLTESDIPPAGTVVALRENANLSTGGTAADCTDDIHPENARLAVSAARAVGIDIAGVDMLAADIARPITETGGAVVEVNAAPGIRMHLHPSAGRPRNVARDIVDYLFPNPRTAHIPVVSVTGTNGKTTTVRLIAHVLTESGLCTGMTSTTGTYLNGTRLTAGDDSGPMSADTLLSDKRVEAAVLETARGGILRRGLGYDLADVGVVTNITADHLGLDGIDTLEDLAFVKSLVVEAVKPEGCAVLNARDAMTPALLPRVKGRLTLFHHGDCPPALLPRAQTRVFTRDGIIWIGADGGETPVANLADIPLTAHGAPNCGAENCLAAVSALHALGLSGETIGAGLRSFRENPGRFQVFEMGGYRVMLDYAHNPAGYAQVAEFCKGQGARRLVGVIGMPADRPDEAIRAAARTCAGVFAQVYIKEDAEPRGRPPLAVARLMRDALLEAGFPAGSVDVIPGEADALARAMGAARPGDFIAVLYERLEPLVAQIEAARRSVPLAIPAMEQREHPI